ncbi:MAG: DUF1552 domain-containing protein [Gemmatimonadetes bacterium]|nr:DUF1552 domain-containing protein [Gemmatimonadota bacterium]NNK64539.1 DUF1552 domain-containing protein [Gemmatimonadota bacterium]NNL64682.1 DUF1552 domain-containing protein [Myxococcales bacterium]
MMHLIGRHIPRRTFLRGVGAAVALPFLDAMRPAGALSALAPGGSAADPTRLVAIEMVHGAAGANEWGATQNLWSPAQAGRDFDFGDSALRTLDAFRHRLNIYSNTDVRMAEAMSPEEIGGDHFRSSAVFLTQAHPKQTEGSDVRVGPSLDQLYARRFGQDTPIPSMQLCIENIDQSGGCAYGYTCVYTDSISWASESEPLPVIRDPRVAFEQLFGAGSTAQERAMRLETDRSILDWITGRVSQLSSELGASDRRRLERYLDNVREVERRIQRIEAYNRSGAERALPNAPAGVPDSFREHVELMFDLQALAFQSDMTRVFSFKMGRDSSARVYPESGSDRPFHPASHHGGREANVLEFNKINTYHVGMLPYFLRKLEEITEGEDSLLDKTMVVYGSPMGDPNLHNHKRCPLIVLGGANGRLDTGRHLQYADGTPMANVMLSLMHALGMDDMDSFGDSTGTAEI